ncbi:MAG: hypothetical protein ACOY31_11320 [Bacillota bacterium]
MLRQGGSPFKYSRIRDMLTVLVLLAMVTAPVWWTKRVDTENPGGVQLVYGEYADWQEVRKAFPMYGKAVVVDFDTGLRFNVQRRGGTKHADVQPLTAADTEVMKKIYGGGWSWNRRAVVLLLDDGRKIAGSMNGMPHGSGLIKGNNFPGHFCIHFRGSKLHSSGREDLMHRVMVCKAAGLLEAEMGRLSPEEVAEVFFAALAQKDTGVFLRAAYFENAAMLPELLNKATEIKMLRAWVDPSMQDEKIKVTLDIDFKDGPSRHRKTGMVRMVPHSLLGWRVDYSSVDSLLKREAAGAIKQYDGGSVAVPQDDD